MLFGKPPSTSLLKLMIIILYLLGPVEMWGILSSKQFHHNPQSKRALNFFLPTK
uniref:Uncharacterized protein n=1 Tax=Arundo donax TaxID=35708 RepID=A0A0A9EVQ7_ARUDO